MPSKADFLRGASLLAGMLAPAQLCMLNGQATSSATVNTAGIQDKENTRATAGTRPASGCSPNAALAAKKAPMKQASPVALRTRRARRAGAPV